MAGKAKHLKDSNKLKTNYFQLVRNTHRLEKGLLMQPRRDVFAKGYIEETVDCYKGIFDKSSDEDNVQLSWFENVLTEYFETVGSDPVIDIQRKRFFEAKDELGLNLKEDKKIPYTRNLNNVDKITFDEFYKLSKQRRSVRWFQNKPVSRER